MISTNGTNPVKYTYYGKENVSFLNNLNQRKYVSTFLREGWT